MSTRKNVWLPFLAILLSLVAVGIPTSRILLKKGEARRYPVKWESEIRAAAEERGVPTAYLASVILAESSYRPEAVSSAGARGLMQIMPETGAWIADKLGEEFNADSLFDPEVSIRYGAWYMGWLSDRYNGDLTCASAAYHSGQGAVDQWLKDPAYSRDGKTLYAFPSKTVETYVERIRKYYKHYGRIYDAL